MTRRPLLTFLIATTALLASASTASALSLVRDTTLGGGTGVTVVPAANPNEFESVAAVRTDPGNGKLLVVTKVGTYSADDELTLTCQYIVIRRFNRDGSLDAAYGRSGEFRSRFGGRAACPSAFGIREGGKLTGTAMVLRGKTSKTRTRERIAFQLDETGRLNKRFGPNGVKRFGSGTWGTYSISNNAIDTGRNLVFARPRNGDIEAVLTSSNGRIKRIQRFRDVSECEFGSDRNGRVLAACVEPQPGASSSRRLVVRRLTKSGGIDRSYGQNGVAVIHAVKSKDRQIWIDGFYAGSNGNSYIEWQVAESNRPFAAKISSSGNDRRAQYRIGNVGLYGPRSGVSGLATLDSDVEGAPNDGQNWMELRVFDKNFNVEERGTLADGTGMLIADFASSFPDAIYLVGTLPRKGVDAPADDGDPTQSAGQLAIQRFSIRRPAP